MRFSINRLLVMVSLVSLMMLGVCGSAAEAEAVLSEKDLKMLGTPNAVFDASKMGDMTGFDPAKWENPTGDVIRIAVAWPHSGPGAINGDIGWAVSTFVAYDINQRGGIMVDGKRKKIALYKADTMARPDQTRTVMERMALREKVHAVFGTSGSHLQKVINAVADRHKIISVNVGALADELMDAENFSRYAFMVADTTEAVGRGMAYFYGQIRKQERKFYIICQDYSFGRSLADGFKKGLKEYYPEAEIMGEDYHRLFETDYAPYLEKVRASGAEAVWTGDWVPDAGNLLSQARAMGINIPFANIFLDEPNALTDIGVEGTRNLFNIKHGEVAGPAFRDEGTIKYYRAWNDNWKNWTTAPYNTPLFRHNGGTLFFWQQGLYWYFSVLERAGTLDPEKIIELWEGDTYQFVNGRIVQMRTCDHRAIQGLRVAEFVPPAEQKISFNIPPYVWFENACNVGPTWDIPAHAILPPMDPKLDRCAGLDGWGRPKKD